MKTRSLAVEFKSPKLRTFNHRIFEVSFTVPQIAMVPTDSSFKEKLPKYLTKGKGAFLADFSKEIHNGMHRNPPCDGTVQASHNAHRPRQDSCPRPCESCLPRKTEGITDIKVITE